MQAKANRLQQYMTKAEEQKDLIPGYILEASRACLDEATGHYNEPGGWHMEQCSA